jgi:hypothetical protein
MNFKGLGIVARALLLFGILLLPLTGFAQEERRKQGYVFGTVGNWTEIERPMIGVGIGGEWAITKGVTWGLEIQGYGATGGDYDFDTYGGFVFAANGSYHFRNTTSRKLVPFATAGFSGLGVCSYECGGATGFNVGGGMNYWFKRNRGLRLEFRDHVIYDYVATHKWELRVGFAF